MAGIDYAEGLNGGNILAGVIMMIYPAISASMNISGFLELEFSVFASAAIILYGFLIVIGGFLQGEALYLRYFLDLAATAGLLLLTLKVLPVLQNSWMNLFLGALIFLAAPSTTMAYVTRESRYEKHTEDDSDYLGSP